VLDAESNAPLNIRVSTASLPSVPDRDRRLLLSVMAMAGGLIGGLAVAYLRSATDSRIRVASDLPFAPRTPFLGYLPQMPAALDPAAEPAPWLQECMRMVRTSLLERLHGSENPVVLITSCSAGAGKSSVAVLLGRSLAHLGKKVLLVEADMLRPSLAPRLGLDEGPGLAGILTGAANDKDAIRKTGEPGFDVLPAGVPQEGFDAELLANGVFAASLRRWRGKYGFVLLDSPPVLPVADARILSRHADGTIMVLRAAHSRKPDIVRACADLNAAGGSLLGTIMVGGIREAGYGNYYDERSRGAGAPRLARA
jgi:receptor protein-tyrosine kinase